MGEDLEPLSDEERERKLEQAFKERDPTLALTCVLRGISRIYELETEACRLPGESYESHLAKVCDARQKQLEVYTWAMTVLSAVCTKFAEQHTSRSGKIRWVQAKAHRLAKLAVYVLNHKDQFGTFLQTGEGAAAVPSHNNPSEGSIRALIVLRKACNFKSSEYGIKHACINFSLVQTAEECGIANVERWLQDYSRAAYIYASRRFFRESIDGPMAGIPNRPTFKIADYLEGFDFEYWLPWNYLKRNPGI